MITNVYTIFDKKAKLYQGLITFINDEVAVRYFCDIFKHPESIYAKHPEDYIVFRIGTYDDSQGVFTQNPYHEDVIDGLNLGAYADVK